SGAQPLPLGDCDSGTDRGETRRARWAEERLPSGARSFCGQLHGERQNVQPQEIRRQPGPGSVSRPEITCTCRVPSRWHLLCQDALAVLKHLGKLDTTMALLDNGYTLDSYRKIHSNPDFPVVRPI
ncbi:unnamed protein product, partial [Pylaiella littoralis]